MDPVSFFLLVTGVVFLPSAAFIAFMTHQERLRDEAVGPAADPAE